MTTEGELNLTEVSWGDHRMRVINIDGMGYIPVTDIAQASEVRKRAYLTHLDRNPLIYKGYEKSARLSTASGNQETRCISPVAAPVMLLKMSANHFKDPQVKLRLIQFAQWFMMRYQDALDSQRLLPAGKTEPDYDAILNKIQFVNKLAELTSWNKLELQKEVLREAGMQSLTWHIEPEQKPAVPALPPAPEKKFKGFYTATDIGKLCGKTAEEVHKWLYQHTPPFIIKGDGDEWRLTEYGKDFAYEHPYCPPNTMILRNRIEWKKEILEKMNIPVQKAMV